jgi:hypothetical protein
LGEAEFMPLHQGDDEGVFVEAFDFNVKAVAPQEDIGGGESDALIGVKEAVVPAVVAGDQRLPSSSRVALSL